MRKKLNVNLIVFTLLSFFTISLVVKAQEYNYDLIPYDVSEVCPEFDEYGEFTYDCWDKYLAGELDNKKITNGLIEPGQKIMVLVNIDPPEDSSVVDMRVVLNYDSSILRSVNYYENIDNLEGQKGGIFPPKPGSTKKTNWTVSTNITENRMVFLLMDSDLSSPIKTSGTMMALFFEVAEDATPGTKTSITFDETKSYLSSGYLNTGLSKKYASLKGLELTVS